MLMIKQNGGQRNYQDMIQRFKEIQERIDYILEYDLQGEDGFDAYDLIIELNDLEQELLDFEGFVSGKQESSRKKCLNIISQIRDVYGLGEY